MKNKRLIRNIRWLGHAGFFIKETPSVYIDPYNLAFPDISNLILITQDHEQHCSPDDIKWLRKGSTVIVAPEKCAKKFEGDIRSIKAGDVLEIKGAKIKVLPAYNESDPGFQQESGGVGYHITFPNGLRIYHTGETGLIKEMKHGMADIVLISIGEHATINASQAAEIINRIEPRVAIPMHWEKNQASKEEIDIFKSLCKVDVEILHPKR